MIVTFERLGNTEFEAGFETKLIFEKIKGSKYLNIFQKLENACLAIQDNVFLKLFSAALNAFEMNKIVVNLSKTFCERIQKA